MPAAPTLRDFYQQRVALDRGAASQLLQSARLALARGEPDNIVLACLLHDISVVCFIRTDHGYWAAQLVAPYVDEEVTWAIQHHQALRYFASPEHDCEYPAFYREVFGEDFVVPDYLVKARDAARAYRWYELMRVAKLIDFACMHTDVRLHAE